MNISKKGINWLISKTILEMLLVTIFVLVSFFTFNKNDIHNTSQVAQAYSQNDNKLQTSFKRTEDNLTDILTKMNLLDEGEISVRNPNKVSKKATMTLILNKEESLYLNNLKIMLNDEIIKMDDVEIVEDTYRIYLDSKDIGAYETYRGIIQFIGDPLHVGTIKYSFDISEVSNI